MRLGIGKLEIVHNILHRPFAGRMVSSSAKFSKTFMNCEHPVVELFTINKKIKVWSVTFETGVYMICHIHKINIEHAKKNKDIVVLTKWNHQLVYLGKKHNSN